MASTRTAIIDHLRGYSTLTGLLGDGQNSIITSARLKADTKTPAVVVEGGMVSGGLNRLPWYDELWMIKVFYNPRSRAGGRWTEVDKILGHIRGRLHDASLSVDDGALWQFKWDGFIGPDMYDFIHEYFFRVIRFRAFRSTSYW